MSIKLARLHILDNGYADLLTKEIRNLSQSSPIFILADANTVRMWRLFNQTHKETINYRI